MIQKELSYNIVFIKLMLWDVSFGFINTFFDLSSLKLYKYTNPEDIRKREHSEISGGKT